jgi:DNA-binding MarR family transcriptional regulator
MSMGTAAEALRCDASNLTGIVDRLEKRGLVERRTLATDRRVKELVLTDAGHEVLGRLEELVTAAPGLSDLSSDEREALLRLLRQVLESEVRAATRPLSELEKPASRPASVQIAGADTRI